MRRLTLALVGLLVGCDGSGCLPGDFISTCARSCGGRVLVAHPLAQLCLCDRAPQTQGAALQDGGGQ